MIKYFILLLLCLCCIFISCTKDTSSIKQQNVTPPLVGKNYSANEITAFKQMTINATNGIIIKWSKNVSIYLVDTVYPTLTTELDSIISELNTLADTNLIITRTTNNTAADIKVYLTDRNTYLFAEPQVVPQTSNYIGLAYLYWNRDNGIINKGSAFVDMIGTDINNQRRIIRHELMHTLGFYGHVSLPEFYSVLFAISGFPFPTMYTSFDKRMIKLLYNPAIKSGMNETALNTVLVNL